MRVGRPYLLSTTVLPKQAGSNVDNKNNIKWILQYVVLAAIICYGSSFISTKSVVRTPQQWRRTRHETKEVLTAFPEALRLYIKYREDEVYWEALYDVFKVQEERNPTFAGGIIRGIILSLEDKSCTDQPTTPNECGTNT